MEAGVQMKTLKVYDQDILFSLNELHVHLLEAYHLLE